MSHSYVKRDDSNTKGGEVMNCKDVAELLPLFLDAELGPEAADQVGAHLATCSACQEILAEYRREQQILQSLPLVAPPSTWRAELLAKVSSSKPRREQPAWRFFVPRLASLAAALLVVLMVSNLYVFPTYWARPDDDSQQRMMIMAVPGEFKDNEQLEPAGDPKGVIEADPPENVGINDSKSEVEPYGLMGSIAAPTNNLQRRWWLWSSGISIVIWLAGAGYFYYNYRRRLQEQLDS